MVAICGFVQCSRLAQQPATARLVPVQPTSRREYPYQAARSLHKRNALVHSIALRFPIHEPERPFDGLYRLQQATPKTHIDEWSARDSRTRKEEHQKATVGALPIGAPYQAVMPAAIAARRSWKR